MCDLPCPNSHRKCGPVLYVCRHPKVGAWGCVWEMVCAVPCSHSVFLTFPSIPHTNFDSFGTIRTRKTSATQWCAQSKRCGGCKIMPREAYWPPLPKGGVTQWWGRSNHIIKFHYNAPGM